MKRFLKDFIIGFLKTILIVIIAITLIATITLALSPDYPNWWAVVFILEIAIVGGFLNTI